MKNYLANLFGLSNKTVVPKGVFQGLQIPNSNIAEQKNEVNSMAAAFERLINTHIPIGTVIDVGASDGRWSIEASNYFKDAQFHLIEARSEHSSSLEDICLKNTGWGFTSAVAGTIDGPFRFFKPPGNPFGGRAVATQYFDNVSLLYNDDIDEKEESRKAFSKLPDQIERHCVNVDSIKIDTLVKQKKLPGPYLIKLDTHGFEVSILKGSEKTLEKTNILIIEVYNLRIGSDVLLFWELCSWLGMRGFRVYDIFDPVRRDSDGMLWQMDFVFLRDSFPGFQKLTT
jgi:FkbM family methyltransferase